MSYACLADSRIDDDIISYFSFYMIYTKSDKKDIFRKYFGVDHAEKNLIDKFGRDFLTIISLHLLQCYKCKDIFDSAIKFIKPDTYICNINYKFNYVTICRYCDYVISNKNKKDLIKSLTEDFGVDFIDIIKKHFEEHNECNECFKTNYLLYKAGSLLVRVKKGN